MSSPAPLDPELIRAHCAAASNPEIASQYEIVTVAETGSTNDDAFAAATRRNARTGHVIFADQQTLGRGRRGDKWEAPSGSSLLFSLLIRPDESLPPAKWPRFPHLAGIALAQATEKVTPKLNQPLALKWPNDLYIGDRKAAGILVESQVSKAATSIVVGIGLNVNTPLDAFPEELQQTATSLSAESGGIVIDRNRLAGQFLATWAEIFPNSVGNEGFSNLRKELLDRSYLLNKRVALRQNNRTRRGEVIGLGPEGELLFCEENLGNRYQPETIVSADFVRVI